MREVFVVSDNILSPVGLTTAENFSNLKNGISGIKKHRRPDMADEPFYASLFDQEMNFIVNGNLKYTRFEQLLIASIKQALEKNSIDPADKNTVLIV